MWFMCTSTWWDLSGERHHGYLCGDDLEMERGSTLGVEDFGVMVLILSIAWG